MVDVDNIEDVVVKKTVEDNDVAVMEDFQVEPVKPELEQELSEDDRRRLIRRIDLRIMPLLFVSYMFQYLDKSALSNTAILGLRKDLHLVGQQYSWASSVFNFGYLVASAPVAIFIVKMPVGKFMAISIAVWAVILMCMGATQNAGGLITTRFFLGFAEAAVAPGFTIITSIWYTRKEQPIRHGVWFLGNVCSGFFGGPLMYAFDYVDSIQPWRLVFLVFGALTLVWSICLAFFLPDSPASAKFLSEEDRIRAVYRVKDDVTGVKHSKWQWPQFWEAFRDPKTWFIVLIMLCTNIPNGGIGNFAAIVINGFGFTVRQTFLVNMIVTAVQGAFIIIATVLSTRLRNFRTICMAGGTLIALVGACLIRQLDEHNRWGRYGGYCLLSAYTANFPLVLTMTAANTVGITKKTTVNAMTFVAYCVGNIIGPQLFFSYQSPSFPSGFASMLVCFVVGFFVTLILRFYLIWENKRRDRVYGPNPEEIDMATLQTVDRTDKEITSYRYVY